MPNTLEDAFAGERGSLELFGVNKHRSGILPEFTLSH
jgi:hypothetical protein